MGQERAKRDQPGETAEGNQKQRAGQLVPQDAEEA